MQGIKPASRLCMWHWRLQLRSIVAVIDCLALPREGVIWTRTDGRGWLVHIPMTKGIFFFPFFRELTREQRTRTVEAWLTFDWADLLHSRLNASTHLLHVFKAEIHCSVMCGRLHSHSLVIRNCCRRRRCEQPPSGHHQVLAIMTYLFVIILCGHSTAHIYPIKDDDDFMNSSSCSLDRSWLYNLDYLLISLEKSWRL